MLDPGGLVPDGLDPGGLIPEGLVPDILGPGELIPDMLDPVELGPGELASHWSSIVAAPELTALKQNSSVDPSFE